MFGRAAQSCEPTATDRRASLELPLGVSTVTLSCFAFNIVTISIKYGGGYVCLRCHIICCLFSVLPLRKPRAGAVNYQRAIFEVLGVNCSKGKCCSAAPRSRLDLPAGLRGRNPGVRSSSSDCRGQGFILEVPPFGGFLMADALRDWLGCYKEAVLWFQRHSLPIHGTSPHLQCHVFCKVRKYVSAVTPVALQRTIKTKSKRFISC